MVHIISNTVLTIILLVVFSASGVNLYSDIESPVFERIFSLGESPFESETEDNLDSFQSNLLNYPLFDFRAGNNEFIQFSHNSNSNKSLTIRAPPALSI